MTAGEVGSLYSIGSVSLVRSAAIICVPTFSSELQLVELPFINWSISSSDSSTVMIALIQYC